ncbi:MAG: hypothetical protein JRH11_14020 [Deltaproteobacteria bacterium]|nr:hypothetical protein [Deltaproteobacteria bacterium]
MTKKGARVTDAVNFFQRRGEMRSAVRVVRQREPERFRWRYAIAGLTGAAGKLRGLDRMRVEEPVREVVLDVGDNDLRREIVIDARKNGVDFDRGEVLPYRSVGDLRRYSFLTRIELTRVGQHIPLDLSSFFTPVDTAATVIIGRHYEVAHRRKAHEIWLSIPDPDGPEEPQSHHRLMANHADREIEAAQRWAAFTKAVLEAPQ